MIGTIGSVVNGPRRRAFLATFLVGNVVGAALIGAALGVVGQFFGLSAWHGAAQSVLALTALALVLGGERVLRVLPYIRRQVRPTWWSRYPQPLTSFAWGVELGSGLLTHVPAATFYVLLLVALFSGPIAGAALLAPFGATRGAQPLIAGLARRWVVPRARAAAPLLATSIGLMAAFEVGNQLGLL